jgi:hypothetical protein
MGLSMGTYSKESEPRQKTPDVCTASVSASPAFEPHLTIQQIATLWQLSQDSVRKLFQNEPDVLEIGQGNKPRKRASYRTFRVPQSVVERVHRKFSLVR